MKYVPKSVKGTKLVWLLRNMGNNYAFFGTLINPLTPKKEDGAAASTDEKRPKRYHHRQQNAISQLFGLWRMGVQGETTR